MEPENDGDILFLRKMTLKTEIQVLSLLVAMAGFACGQSSGGDAPKSIKSVQATTCS